MDKKSLVLISLLTLIILSVIINQKQQNWTQFQNWKSTYKVEFASQSQDFYRRSIFYQNLAKIEQHNSDLSKTYLQGINQFIIYTSQEFVEKFLTNRFINLIQNVEVTQKEAPKNVIIDWTTEGAVGPVKNQGACASATVYATIGGVEGLSKIAYGTLKIFSSQELIDCVYGCHGGLMDSGYKYIQSHGLCTAAQYPDAGTVQTCKNLSCAFKISGYSSVSNCNDLLNAIKKQPVSVAVDATNWASYTSGIFTNCQSSLNHMVLLTGVADEYWKLKNSWGTSWGEKGYIRIGRGDTCGICKSGIYPLK